MCFAIAAVFVSFIGAIPVDTYTYNIKGVVLDNNGNHLEGAKVSATYRNVELGAVTSSDNGEYDLKFETVKEYTGADLLFVVSREGFHKKAVPNIPIQAGAPLIVNFKLERDLKAFEPDKDAELYRTSEFFQLIESNRY